jgi:transposase
VTDVSFDSKGVIVTLRLRERRRRICSVCGQTGRHLEIVHYRTNRWRHLDLGVNRCLLECDLRRLRCPDCGVRYEAVRWARPGAPYTRDFEDVVAFLAQQMAKTPITRLMRIAWDSVGDIITRVVADHLSDVRFYNLVLIGVDEISYRRGQRYLTCVADQRDRVGQARPGRRHVAGVLRAAGRPDATPSRRSRSTCPPATTTRSRPSPSRMSGSGPRSCSTPSTCAKLASRAVDDVRRADWNEHGKSKTKSGRWIKHVRWSLLKAPERQSEAQLARLAEVATTNKRLYRAFLLKEELRLLYHLPDPAKATEHLDAWLADRPAGMIAAVSDGGRSGRSPGDTARLLEAFLVARGLVLASDERGRLAHGRRARRIERCPAPLRPAAERYLTWLLAGRERARRIGEHPLKDHTIEQRLAVVAQFAMHLDQQGVRDWATCSRSHIEAFLATGRDRGVPARGAPGLLPLCPQGAICLADPTAGLAHRPARGFRGRTLTRSEQARLLRRWAHGDCHPHEALVGLLSLLHGASVSELRALTVTNVNTATRTVRLGRRPHRVPLDPLSFAALERCFAHRAGLGHREPAGARHSRHPCASRPCLPAVSLARARRRWRLPEPAASDAPGGAHPSLRPATRGCRLRDDTRRSAALPDRRGRDRSRRVREPVSADSHSSHVHSNLCALPNGRLVVTMVAPFSLRSEMTWKTSSAAPSGKAR